MKNKFGVNFSLILFLLSGLGSLSAQPQGWSDPILISGNLSGIQHTPYMDLAGSQINVVWTNYSSPMLNHEVFMVERLNGSWTSPLNISHSDSFPSSIPRVLLEQNGDLHLFWGDRTDSLSPRPVQQPDHLFYKNRINSSFSQPETLLVSYHPLAGMSAPEVTFNVGHNIVYLFLSPPPDTTFIQDPQFLLIKRQDNLWSNPVKVDSGFYPNPYNTDDDRIHLAFIYSVKDSSLGFDRNSVFYMFSDDGGTTWSNRIVVDTSGFERPAFDPQIVVNSQGQIHIVFARSIDGDLFPDLIFHRKSNDGIQWTFADSFPANFPGDHYPGVIGLDSGDRIHLMWYHNSFSPQHQSGLYYSIWDGISWSQPQYLFPIEYWEDFHFKIHNDIIHLVWAGSCNGVQGIYYSWKDAITGMDQLQELPQIFNVSLNYPNPFNPTTTIKYQLPKQSDVKLVIYNLLGQKVRTLINGQVEAGYHTAVWDGRNDKGMQAASGVYIYRFEAGDYVKTMKMMLLK